MISEHEHLSQKYASLYERLKEHHERLNNLTIEQQFHTQPHPSFGYPMIESRKPTAYAKSLMNDICNFWNEMCKVNDQAERRTDRPIVAHATKVQQLRPKLEQELEYYRVSYPLSAG